MKCEYCNNAFVEGATECPWCGAKIPIPEKKEPDLTPYYSRLLRKDRLLVDETEVERIELNLGTLMLTTKKIRGNVSVKEIFSGGRKAAGLKTIDTLLTMVTGYSVVHIGASTAVQIAAVAFLAAALACMQWSAVFAIAMLIGSIICFVKIAMGSETHLRIAIPGGDIDLKLGATEVDAANRFVQAVRKAKAEYELKAGL